MLAYFLGGLCQKSSPRAMNKIFGWAGWEHAGDESEGIMTRLSKGQTG